MSAALASREPISELTFARQWRNCIAQCTKALESGWYCPPPFGISALFCTTTSWKRNCFDNLRDAQNWPSDTNVLDARDGLATFYASPVDIAYGMIGDVGVTIYLGNDPAIRSHFRRSYDMVCQIAECVRPGVTMKEIHDLAISAMQAHGWQNAVISPSDPTGMNIGHTVPRTREGWSTPELAAIRAMSPTEVSQAATSSDPHGRLSTVLSPHKSNSGWLLPSNHGRALRARQ